MMDQNEKAQRPFLLDMSAAAGEPISPPPPEMPVKNWGWLSLEGRVVGVLGDRARLKGTEFSLNTRSFSEIY